MKLILKHTFATIILVLGLGIVTTILCTQYVHALDESDKIAVVAFEFEIKQLQSSSSAKSFCLMMGIVILRVLSDEAQPVGNGASPDVVSALRRQRYNVFSSDDCVYKGRLVGPRSSLESSILLGILPFKYNGEDSLLVSSGYEYWGSCQKNLLTIKRQNGDFSVTESKMELIC